MIQQVVGQAYELKFIHSFYPWRDKSDIGGPLDDLVMTPLSVWPSLDWFDLFN